MSKILLLIEDDFVILDMYQTLLSNHGYRVNTAMDGEDGLNKALQNHPDLILLDIRMPKMDGMTMLKHLRQDDWGAKVPVIILTNVDANDEILKGVVGDHPAYYLIKSNTEPAQLLEKVKSILEDDKQENN